MAEQIDSHRKRALELALTPALSQGEREQEKDPKSSGLTLIGMYNVLEAVKEGRDLTAKERTIHTQGLVGVLKELHDDLDAAVLHAYGLEVGLNEPQNKDALLRHLVTLNAQRTAEKKMAKFAGCGQSFKTRPSGPLLTHY